MNPIRQAKADLDRIAAHGYLELAERGRLTLRLLLGYQATGYPTGSTGGSGGGHADTTGNAATNLHHDQIDHALGTLTAALAKIVAGLTGLDTATAVARTLTTKEVADILKAERPGVLECNKCHKLVTNLPGDKIKHGLCPACYQADYRRRNPTGQIAATVTTTYGTTDPKMLAS